ncbi:30S ribosomal protein S9 [Patescibacteria group bacterium]|nr:30S ribosomal protein S9 [Patescibacteria group bacterium]
MPTKKDDTKAKKKEKVEIATPGGKYNYAHGKRKTSIATARLYKGKGVITVNNKPISEYVSVKSLIGVIKSPLKQLGVADKYDITLRVQGGGISSQAEAMRHAIAKGLLDIDPLNKPSLKSAGMLTRDSRTKERKKFGLKRARKAPQFSKR